MARRRSSTALAPAESAPRLRGRPPVISSERLLDIAREVFLEKGIRATTADVASRAGIAEGTIFHRFKSKDELFRAAMRFDPEDVPAPLKDLPSGATADLRETLVTVAIGLLDVARIALPMMIMSWSNPASEYSLDKMVARKLQQRPYGFRRALLNLIAFFEQAIEARRLRDDANPEALARVFMGSLHHFCMTALVFGGEQVAGTQPTQLLPKDYVEHLVDLLLRGAAPVAPVPPRSPKTRPK